MALEEKTIKPMALVDEDCGGVIQGKLEPALKISIKPMAIMGAGWKQTSRAHRSVLPQHTLKAVLLLCTSMPLQFSKAAIIVGDQRMVFWEKRKQLMGRTNIQRVWV